MNFPDPQQPHTYSRRILLAVEAYSPQTITETLYALTQTSPPPFVPTEVHIVTTKRGRDRVQQALIHENRLQRLCADYQLPDTCTNPFFHLISGTNGEPLWDVRSEQDNECTADFISQQVRQLTTAPDSSLYVLLSGGRRTMTYYVGYALSLFGRPQDRLKHVLVDDCYFFLKDFYYPPPQSLWLQDRDGTEFDASKVEITLADIPFVRLRDGLPAELLAGSSSFSATITAAQKRFAPPDVHLDWRNARLTCNGIAVTMPPVQLAFYAWMLERRIRSLPPLHWTDQESTPLAGQFLSIYKRLHGTEGNYGQVTAALQRDGMTKAYFDERKSGVHKSLKNALGAQVADAYLLHPHGKRPVTRFGLTLPVRCITQSC